MIDKWEKLTEGMVIVIVIGMICITALGIIRIQNNTIELHTLELEREQKRPTKLWEKR